MGKEFDIDLSGIKQGIMDELSEVIADAYAEGAKQGVKKGENELKKELQDTKIKLNNVVAEVEEVAIKVKDANLQKELETVVKKAVSKKPIKAKVGVEPEINSSKIKPKYNIYTNPDKDYQKIKKELDRYYKEYADGEEGAEKKFVGYYARAKAEGLKVKAEYTEIYDYLMTNEKKLRSFAQSVTDEFIQRFEEIKRLESQMPELSTNQNTSSPSDNTVIKTQEKIQAKLEQTEQQAKETATTLSEINQSSVLSGDALPALKQEESQVEEINEDLEKQSDLYKQIYDRIEKIRMLGTVGANKKDENDIVESYGKESRNAEAFKMQMEAIKKLSPTGEMNPDIRDMVLNSELSIEEVAQKLVEAAEEYITCKKALDDMFAKAGIAGGKVYDEAYRNLNTNSLNSMGMFEVIGDTRQKLALIKSENTAREEAKKKKEAEAQAQAELNKEKIEEARVQAELTRQKIYGSDDQTEVLSGTDATPIVEDLQKIEVESEETKKSIQELEEELVSLASTYRISFNKDAKFDFEFDKNFEIAQKLQSVLDEIYKADPSYSIDNLIAATQESFDKATAGATEFNNVLKEIRKGTGQWSYNKLLNDPDAFAKDLNAVADEYYKLVNTDGYDEKQLLNIEARFNAMLSSQHKLYTESTRLNDDYLRGLANKIQSQLTSTTSDLQDQFWEGMANGKNMSSDTELREIVKDRLGYRWDIDDTFATDHLKEILDFLRDIESVKKAASKETLISNEEAKIASNLEMAKDLENRYKKTAEKYEYDSDPEWFENQYKYIAEYVNNAEEAKEKLAELKGEVYELQKVTPEDVKNRLVNQTPLSSDSSAIIEENKEVIKSNEEVIASEEKVKKYRVANRTDIPKLKSNVEPIKDTFDTTPETTSMEEVVTATDKAIESKKDFATANEGVQASVDGSKSKLELEAELMESIAKNARDAAEAKKDFVKANEGVEKSATNSSASLDDEAKGIGKVEKSAEKVNEIADVDFKPNTEGFDEIISKLGIIKEKSDEISKITWDKKEQKYLESYNIKYKDGSNEIRGENSNNNGSNILRANEVAYDSKKDAKLLEINKQLGKELDKQDKQRTAAQQKRWKEFEKEQQDYLKKQNDEEITKKRDEAFKNLTRTISEYEVVKKRIANGEALEGDTEAADKLEEKISNLQKQPILSSSQLEKSEKQLENIYDDLIKIEKKNSPTAKNNKRAEEIKKMNSDAQTDSYISKLIRLGKQGKVETTEYDKLEKTIKSIINLQGDYTKELDGSEESINRLDEAAKEFNSNLIKDFKENRISLVQSFTSSIDQITNDKNYGEKDFEGVTGLRGKVKSLDDFELNNVDDLKKLVQLINEIGIGIKQIKAIPNENLLPDASEISKDLGKINSILAGGYKMPQKLKQEFKDLQIAYQNAFDSDGKVKITNKELQNLRNTLSKVNAEFDATGKKKSLFGSFSQRLTDMNTKFLAQYLSFQDIIRYGRQAFETIKEYDTALTEMNKVSEESIHILKEFQKESFELADTVGTTASAIQSSTADFMRLGRPQQKLWTAPLYGNI